MCGHESRARLQEYLKLQHLQKKKKNHQQLVIYAGDKGVKMYGWQEEERTEVSAIARHENEFSDGRARPRLR